MLGAFDKLFSIVIANDEALRSKCFQLRHHVYSMPEHRLDKDTRLLDNKIAIDEYDATSLHCLLLYKPTQQYVGTVRLIPGNLRLGQEQFPIEIQFKKYFYNVIDYLQLESNHLAEISRLVLVPGFRPKFAVLGLLRGILQLCVNSEIFYIYVAMPPKLARTFERLGIKLVPISPIINYHGHCQCYFGFIQEIIESVRKSHPQIWEALTNNGEITCKENIFYQSSAKLDDDDEKDCTFI